MFILRKEEEAYTVLILQPRLLDTAAVEWATKHLLHQYEIKASPEIIEAADSNGFDLTIAASLLQWTYADRTIVEKNRLESFLTRTTDTLQEVRAAAVRANQTDLDEVFLESAVLKSKFEAIFSLLLDGVASAPNAQQSSSREHTCAVTPKATTPVRKHKQPRLAVPSQAVPEVSKVREMTLPPNLPMLKRRRYSTDPGFNPPPSPERPLTPVQTSQTEEAKRDLGVRAAEARKRTEEERGIGDVERVDK